MVPVNRVNTSREIGTLFRRLIQESASFPPPSSHVACSRHLQILAHLSPSLPAAFRPTSTQLTTPHYFGVDMIPSASLRNRLCLAGSDVAHAFLEEFDCTLLTTSTDENRRLIIWGENPHNELAWEFSAEIISRWGWLIGPTWVERANFWRTQRGLASIPLPVEAPVESLWAMWQQLQLGTLGGGTMASAMVGMGMGPMVPPSHHMQPHQRRRKERTN